MVHEAAQNEQAGLSPPKKSDPDFEDLFGMAMKKQIDVLADPFSEFLMSTTTKESAGEMTDEVKKQSTTEVSGTGGGWGDDEDDIDID